MTESSVESVSDLAHEIHMHMLTHGFQWRLESGLRTPTPEEVQEGLNRMKERLRDEPVGTSLAGGRIIIHKAENGENDVYVHYGTA